MKRKSEIDSLLAVNLKVGQEYRVQNLTADSTIKKRLLDMGIVPGLIIKVEKVAPLGDPIDIIVRGYHLTLRREEISAISLVENDSSHFYGRARKRVRHRGGRGGI